MGIPTKPGIYQASRDHKKTLAASLSLMMALSLIGCSGNAGSKTMTVPPAETQGNSASSASGSSSTSGSSSSSSSASGSSSSQTGSSGGSSSNNSSSSGAPVPSAPITGYHLTFDDEFNTLSASNDPYLDQTLWCTCSWWYPPQGTANMYTQDGMVNLLTTEDTPGDWSGSWTGAHLSTWSPTSKGFSQKFGYWEMRFKPSDQDGILNAFYLISEDDILTDGAYPTDEMDIFEIPKGNIIDLTLHDGVQQDYWRWNEVSVPADFDQNFHTMGLLWQENSPYIQWYLDGNLVMQAAKFDDTDLSPMVMTLESYVNGAFSVPDSTTANPSDMIVDYVRVWSNDPSIPLWSAQN